MKSIQQLRHDLREGVIAFPVTPFKAKDLSLDLAGYKKNVEEMMDYPFAALVAAGGTGEMYSITPEEQVALVKATVEISGGKIRIPNKGGLGVDLDYDQLARLKERYEKTPYRNRDDQAEMRKHVDPTWERKLPRW